MDNEYFKGFLGNETALLQLSSAVKTGRASHCYMFCGEKGLGKHTLAKMFAKALMCENNENRPCGHCKSCIQIENEDHPDVIYIRHEKPTLFSVDEIRDFSKQMYIRPYTSDRRIFILKDAQLLNVQAQNAALKTIEEPPEYGMILLLTDNKEAFLPTVLSRCTEVALQPLSDELVSRGLKDAGIEDAYITDDLLKRAAGNLGMAKRLLTDEALMEKTMAQQRCLEELCDMTGEQIWNEAVRLGAEKEDLPMLFSMMRTWFSDLAKCKAGYTRSATPAMRRISEKYDLSDFPRIFEAIDTAERQRKVNVSPELAAELMLIKCRPQSKE